MPYAIGDFSGGDPGRRHRGFFHRLRRGISIRNVRRGLGSVGGYLPGPFSALQYLGGDPGTRSSHLRGGHKVKTTGGTKHAVKSHPGGHAQHHRMRAAGRGLAAAAGEAFRSYSGGGEFAPGSGMFDAFGQPTEKHHARFGGGGGMGGFGRRRRINPTNQHALRRAERRLTSFVKLYTKTARHLGYTLTRHHAARLHGKKGKR